MLTKSVFLLGTALLCVSLSQAKAPIVEDTENGLFSFFHKAMPAVTEFVKGMELFPKYSDVESPVLEGLRPKSVKELFGSAYLSSGQPAKNFAPKSQAQQGIDLNSELFLEGLYPSFKQADKESHHTQEIEAEMQAQSATSSRDFKQEKKAQAELDRESNVYSSIAVQTSQDLQNEVLPPIQPVSAADPYKYGPIYFR